MKPLRVLISLVLCTVCLTGARGQIGEAFNPEAKIIAASIFADVAVCPWDNWKRLVQVGETVTALYEVSPTSLDISGAQLATARLKYNAPSDNSLQIIERNITYHNKTIDQASKNLKLATAVASFTMLISRPVEQNIFTEKEIKALVESAASYDTEFIHFVETHNRLIDYK